MTESLFADFEGASYADWIDAVRRSLRGESLESLTKPNYEDFDIQPFPHADDLAAIQHHRSLPGQAPFVRGSKAAGYRAQSWLIAAEIPFSDPPGFNRALREGLAMGHTAIALTGDLALHDEADLRCALADIDLAPWPLLVQSSARAPDIYRWLRAMLDREALDRLRGCVAYDPLSQLARTGAPPDGAFERLAAHLRLVGEQSPQLGGIGVGVAAYHEAGANASQELALALASGVAYLRALDERGLAVASVAPKLHFNLNIGENFFLEVAKLRALRLLWSQVLRAFRLQHLAARMSVHARAGARNKSRLDPFVNLLRLTTEALSAVLGGVDSVALAPFDAPLGSSDAFPLRLSRNLQLILGEELRLTELIDPAGGGWHVEKLTDQLARAAWSRFQAIEAEGGLLASLLSGRVEAEIAEVAARRRRDLATGDAVLVGVNRYVDESASPANTDDKSAAETASPGALSPIRLAEAFETRLRSPESAS